MGIGAGFAMGLVKGFTQNMLVEQQKRISDREKVSAFEQAVFEKVIGPADERSTAGIAAARDMIKNAKLEMENRGGIDLFGTASGELDLDMASIQNTLDDVAQGSFYFGSGNTKVPVMQDRPNSIGVGQAFSLFAEFKSIIKNPEYRKNLQTDPNAWNQMNGMINSARDAIMYNNKTSSAAEGKAFQRINWDAPQFEWIKDFNSLRPDGADEITSTASAASQALSSDGTNVGQAWVIVGEDGAEQWGNFTFSSDEDTANNQRMAIAKIGKNLNAPSSQDVYPLYRKNVAIPGVDDQTLITFFGDSVRVGTPGSNAYITNVENLNPNHPNSFLYNLNDTEMANVANKLDAASSTGQFKNAVAVLYPYMLSPSQDGLTTNQGMFLTVDASMTREAFTRKMYYGSDVYKSKSFNDLVEEYDTNLQVVTQLDRLGGVVKEQGVVNAYQIVKQTFIRNPINFANALISDFSDKNSVVNIVGIDTSNITVREDGYVPSDPNEKFITRQFLREQDAILKEAAQRDKDEPPRSDGITYAEIATLKLGLAFKMARAADPSGRLSNQDVQQQLDRLGNDFDSPEQVMAKIAIVQEEFQRRVDKLEILTKYGRGQGTLTPENRAVIEAAIAADHIIRSSGKGMSPTGSSQESLFTDYVASRRLQTEGGDEIYTAYSSDPQSADFRRHGSGNAMYFMKVPDGQGGEKYQPLPEDAVLVPTRSSTDTTQNTVPQTQNNNAQTNQVIPEDKFRPEATVDTNGNNNTDDSSVTKLDPADGYSVRRGNATDGATLTDDDGAVIAGTWVLKDGMWVPKGGVAPTAPVM